MQIPRSSLLLLLSLAVSAALLVGPACIIVDGKPYGIDWGRDAVRGSGRRASEERSIDDFSAVQLAMAAKVLVVVGEPTSITLSGDDNLIALVTTEVRGGWLVIDTPRGQDLRFRQGLEVRLGTPDLSRFEVEGSGDVEIQDVKTDHFHLSIEGSGDVVASGVVDHLEADIEGSGDMKLQRLHAREAAVSIEGSGDVRVHVVESLRYSIEGSGDIRYDGAPHVSGEIEGSGSVRGE